MTCDAFDVKRVGTDHLNMPPWGEAEAYRQSRDMTELPSEPFQPDENAPVAPLKILEHRTVPLKIRPVVEVLMNPGLPSDYDQWRADKIADITRAIAESGE